MPVEFKYTTEEFEYTVTVYEEETEYYEDEVEEIEDNTLCNQCGRTFKGASALKQHQTVMGHNGQ